MLSEHVGGVRSLFQLQGALLLSNLAFPRSQDLGIGSSVVSLLLPRDLLESIEFFSVEFVEFGVDVYWMLASEEQNPCRMYTDI